MAHISKCSTQAYKFSSARQYILESNSDLAIPQDSHLSEQFPTIQIQLHTIRQTIQKYQHFLDITVNFSSQKAKGKTTITEDSHSQRMKRRRRERWAAGKKMMQ